MIRIEKWCTLDEMNVVMANYAWPVGHKSPPIHASVFKGTRGTIPESGTRLRYTASQMLHWAKH
eukprot:157923-Pleurochrysis_carterae.AAC.1